MRVSKASKGFVFSFLAAILFGVIPLFVHLIGDLGIGVYMLVFFKNLFSLPFLILFSHMFEKRRVFPIGRMPFLQCCLMSLAGAVVTIILLFSSYSLIGTAAATSLHFLYPVFILLIGVLVTAHEFGHFLVAKMNGVVVEEFSLGFGPRLLSTVRGGTRYSLKLLLFGGSCQMKGMYEDYDEDDEY